MSFENGVIHTVSGCFGSAAYLAVAGGSAAMTATLATPVGIIGFAASFFSGVNISRAMSDQSNGINGTLNSSLIATATPFTTTQAINFIGKSFSPLNTTIACFSSAILALLPLQEEPIKEILTSIAISAGIVLSTLPLTTISADPIGATATKVIYSFGIFAATYLLSAKLPNCMPVIRNDENKDASRFSNLIAQPVFLASTFLVASIAIPSFPIIGGLQTLALSSNAMFAASAVSFATAGACRIGKVAIDLLQQKSTS